MLKLIYVVISIAVPFIGVKAQQKSTDTLLNMVISEPFFYNIVGSTDGKIFAGTSKGIMQVDGKDVIPFIKESGYITLNKAGRPIISETGISNYHERKYLHLLPYPDQSRDEFHAGTRNNFYICSGGRLFIFNVLPYLYSYANHSIRTISSQFIGTYSGIYRKGIRIDYPIAPPFTDGYIREINGKAFICYDYLLMFDIRDTLNNSRFLNVSIKEKGGIRDIAYSNDLNCYYVFATQYIFNADTSFASAPVIYTSTNKKKNISYIGSKNETKEFLFTDDSLLLRISFQKKIDTLRRFNESILAGTIAGIHTYLLSSSNLYIYNHNQTIEKISLPIKKAHSLVAASETELVISSDEGIYLLNTVTKEVSPLVNGVEFNRRALYIEKGKIFAGSINGLFTLDVNRLKEISADIVKRQTSNLKISLYVYVGIAFFLLTILVLALFLLRSRKQLLRKTIEIQELNPILINKEKIVEYISNNLPNASLKSIAEHFNTNNSYIYRLLAPDKPGTIISQIRKEIVEKMKKEGKSSAEISSITGLSKSYLSKI